MKHFLFISLLLITGFLNAQENILTTSGFSIEGKVKKPFVFSLANAGNFSIVSIDSVIIYNHLHQFKSVVRNIKGILLKDILANIEFDSPNPTFK